MSKENVSAFLKKYTMVIVLVIVTLFFTWKTGGRMLLPQNVNNLISQNSYVFILATGMLLCILTGGNIDLSVGSVVCFAGAVGATFMVNKGMSVGVSILIMLVTGLATVSYTHLASNRAFSTPPSRYLLIQSMTLLRFIPTLSAIWSTEIPSALSSKILARITVWA